MPLNAYVSAAVPALSQCFGVLASPCQSHDTYRSLGTTNIRQLAEAR